MNSPLISIITPTLNPREFFARTVESVRAQTLGDWEWIVVDDGSTGDVPDLAAVDPRITVLRQRNGGQAAARNLAMSRARGEFLAFVDDDDVWLPFKLERQLELLRSAPDAPFCHTHFERIDAHDNPCGTGTGADQTTYLQLLSGCGICASTVVARREAVVRAGGFNFLVNTSEDYDLWLKLARDAPNRAPFIGLGEPLALYRMHENATSSRYEALHRASRQILQQHLSLALARGETDIARAAREGLKNIGRNYGGQAWAAFLKARHEGERDPNRHFFYALRHAPQMTMRQLAAKARPR